MRDELNLAMKTAMKEKDTLTLSTVRLILAALKERDIAARGHGNADGIPDEEILGLLQYMIKQRRESVRMYIEGNRPELADREASEIKVIEKFLPQQLDEAQMRVAISAAIEKVGAESIRDMGKVMGELKDKFTGRMDFAKAGSLVKELLG